MLKICKNCHWKVKSIGLRKNWCLNSKTLHDVKLKDTCKNFVSKNLKK